MQLGFAASALVSRKRAHLFIGFLLQACTPRLPRKLTKAPAWQQEFAAGATQAQPLVGVQYIHPEQEEGGAAQYHVVHPSRVDDATEQESRERRADMM